MNSSVFRIEQAINLSAAGMQSCCHGFPGDVPRVRLLFNLARDHALDRDGITR
jgi:hypothetical protein